jgi:catechol 2,3-dioxygenase-like lactoylglutathione lyase family enzyme
MQAYDFAIPTLPCRSVAATIEFYQGLGFDGGAHEFNRDYAILERGAVKPNFFTHKALVPSESSAGCYIRVLDVERICRAFSANRLPRTGIPRIDALEDKPWGLREFALIDPDGNLLRIGQIISS